MADRVRLIPTNSAEVAELASVLDWVQSALDGEDPGGFCIVLSHCAASVRPSYVGEGLDRVIQAPT